jgi:hypothetical protein
MGDPASSVAYAAPPTRRGARELKRGAPSGRNAHPSPRHAPELDLAAMVELPELGDGLLKALSRGGGEGHAVGVLPAPLGAANRHHTPYWGVAVFFCVAAVVVAAAGGREQELVLFYAVAVFMSFLFGLLSMAAFSRREGARLFLVVNASCDRRRGAHARREPPPRLPDRLAGRSLRDRPRAAPAVAPGGQAARGVRGRAAG